MRCCRDLQQANDLLEQLEVMAQSSLVCNVRRLGLAQQEAAEMSDKMKAATADRESPASASQRHMVTEFISQWSRRTRSFADWYSNRTCTSNEWSRQPRPRASTRLFAPLRFELVAKTLSSGSMTTVCSVD